MRISLNWLRELVNVELAVEELAEILTIAGLEVEDIDDRRQLADGVVVGKILDRQPHPNADKLSVCEVDIGEGNPAMIVCGAPNAQADIFVPVATVGTVLPAIDIKIKPTKLRGVKSHGMICSLAELGLATESEGIHIFVGDNITVGEDVRPLLGLDDVILEIMPTANRADAMSMVGVAREVAALTGAKLTLPEINPTSFAKSKKLSVAVKDSAACPAYLGTVIEGVTIDPSPFWLQQRLEAAGIRPINNVVDVTNLVLLEWGQPLHAFDGDHLQALSSEKSLTIGVRFANAGETCQTLDGQERVVKPDNLLITANDYPVALAGVMGGAETEVNDKTQNLVLETALFDGVTIRRSSRAQSLRTESSTRYERGVNQAGLETACQRAITLIIQLAGGKAVSQVIHDARPKLDQTSIHLRLSRIQQILGPVEGGVITKADVERILSDLDCVLKPEPSESDCWNVNVPPYRSGDLEREIDLIEEVARLYGYDRFCDELPDKTEAGKLSFEYRWQRRLREAFRGAGLTEVVHYSLVSPAEAEVVIANPLFTEYSALRTNLLDGLINAFVSNQDQGNGAINAFETGRIFHRKTDDIQESDAIAGIFGGEFFTQGRWTKAGKVVPMTWYEAKGLIESALSCLGSPIDYCPEDSDSRLHPGRTAALWLMGAKIGIFGQLHPQLQQDNHLPEATYAFEINLTQSLSLLERKKSQVTRFQTYSSYPSVARDLAFFAPLDVSVSELIKVMKRSGGVLLEAIELFDDYRGQNVPEKNRSLAFSLAYRASDRTLTDAEVDPAHDKIRQALVKQFEVNLRS